MLEVAGRSACGWVALVVGNAAAVAMAANATAVAFAPTAVHDAALLLKMRILTLLSPMLRALVARTYPQPYGLHPAVCLTTNRERPALLCTTLAVRAHSVARVSIRIGDSLGVYIRISVIACSNVAASTSLGACAAAASKLPASASVSAAAPQQQPPWNHEQQRQQCRRGQCWQR